MPSYRAVVFDLDDTLYPERQYALSGFGAAAQWGETHLGIPREQAYLELKGLFEAGVRRVTFDRWLEQHGIAPERHVAELVARYRQHLPVLSPFPEVMDVLDGLRSSYRLAVLTQGHAPGQRAKLQALGLEAYFDPILILGEVDREHWKPSRKAFERLLAALELPGEQVAYIGDNPAKDFHGARQLAITTVRVRRDGGEHSRAEPPEPSFAAEVEVADLLQVPAALGLEFSRP